MTTAHLSNTPSEAGCRNCLSSAVGFTAPFHQYEPRGGGKKKGNMTITIRLFKCLFWAFDSGSAPTELRLLLCGELRRKCLKPSKYLIRVSLYSLELLSEHQAELSANQLLLLTPRQPSAPVTANQQFLLPLMHSCWNEIQIIKQSRKSVPLMRRWSPCELHRTLSCD